MVRSPRSSCGGPQAARSGIGRAGRAGLCGAGWQGSHAEPHRACAGGSQLGKRAGLRKVQGAAARPRLDDARAPHLQQRRQRRRLAFRGHHQLELLQAARQLVPVINCIREREGGVCVGVCGCVGWLVEVGMGGRTDSSTTWLRAGWAAGVAGLSWRGCLSRIKRPAGGRAACGCCPGARAMRPRLSPHAPACLRSWQCSAGSAAPACQAWRGRGSGLQTPQT